MNNRIGGTLAAQRNVISGNTSLGILIDSVNNASANTIQGNLIGTDATGTNGLANSTGVSLAANDTLIGGTNVAARNIIAGPGGFDGIFVGAVTGTRIQGNFIGTDATGSRALGLRYGIALDSTASATQIGGPTATPGTPPGNVVTSSSFEQAIQVGVSEGGGNGNIIQGNLVCTDATGRNPLGHARFGIGVYGAFNLISSNVISGSVGEAGLFAGTSAAKVHDNLIQGNFIGLNASGTARVGGAFSTGVSISNASATIGGTNPGEGNVIAANTGIIFGGNPSLGHSSGTVQGNFIGLDTTGDVRLGNTMQGVLLTDTAFLNTIGGTDPLTGNFIASFRGP
jgi:hypothetical protein